MRNRFIAFIFAMLLSFPLMISPCAAQGSGTIENKDGIAENAPSSSGDETNGASENGPGSALLPHTAKNYKVEVSYPILGQNIDVAVANWIDEIIAGFKDDMEKNRVSPDMPDENSLIISYSLTAPSPKAASIALNVFSALAGYAHPGLNIMARTYSTDSGMRLGLSDMFRKPDRVLELLSAYCRNELEKRLGPDADKEMIKEGTIAHYNNFSCLALTPEGLRVHFQPYQVGPWSIGAQVVDVPLKELIDAGPNMTLWNKN